MGSEDFEVFKQRLLDRHTNRATSGLSTVGDVLWLASVPLGVMTRNVRVFGAVFIAGSVVATGAHLFQSGTVTDELTSVLRHPAWAVRAEFDRVFGR